MRMLDFRKLLSSIPEEVLLEVSSGTTSSRIELGNFRKKYFRKLLSSILEEVLLEQLLLELSLVTSGSYPY